MEKQHTMQGQAGFTLVELAIVMMIIGLLIGGVLKGQELLANARVTSTISQVKAVEAAVTAFRDTYRALPGDMINARNRLPNCSATTNCNNGDGNNIIGPVDGLLAYNNGEPVQFWKHLLLADLISGVTPNAAANNPAWGETYPSSNMGGGFHIAYSNGTANIGGTVLSYANGHYLRLQNSVGTAPTTAAGQQVMSPLRAAQIDRKMDDGAPNQGIVLGHGNDSCTGNSYSETVTQKNCNLLVGIMN